MQNTPIRGCDTFIQKIAIRVQSKFKERYAKFLINGEVSYEKTTNTTAGIDRTGRRHSKNRSGGSDRHSRYTGGAVEKAQKQAEQQRRIKKEKAYDHGDYPKAR
jgi:hypothetical protein